MKARAEASAEQAEIALQEALTKLQAAGVATPAEALTRAAEIEEKVTAEVAQIEAHLKEAAKRE